MSNPQIPDPGTLLAAARASTGRLTDWEVAFHEAGHVVAEVAIAGSFPDSAYISDDGQVDHGGRTSTRSFMGVGPRGAVDVGGDERLAKLMDRQRRKYAAVLLAGQLATKRALEVLVDPCDIVFEVLEAEDDELTTDVAKVRALVEGLLPGHAEIFIEEAMKVADDALRALLASLMAGVELDHLRLLPRRPAWWAEAACRGRPDVNFFPGRGGNTASAKALCAGCGSSAPCLAYALADPTLHGIWAGTTAADRKELRRRLAAA